MSFRRPVVLAMVVAAGTFTGAAVAYVCHPSVAGTRMLTVHGSVVSVKAHGAGFDLVLKRGTRNCTQLSWNVETGTSRSLALACPAPVRLQASSIPSALDAGPAGQHVVVARGSGNAPDLLKVLGAGGDPRAHVAASGPARDARELGRDRGLLGTGGGSLRDAALRRAVRVSGP